MATSTISVLIVEHTGTWRRGIPRLLRQHPGIRLIGSTHNLAEARQLLQLHRPDVVLIDLWFSDGNGGLAWRQVMSAYPATRMVLLTSSEDERFAAESMLRGAAGYLVKEAGRDELVATITTVASGGTLVTQALTEKILHRMSRVTLIRAERPRLSHQEEKVLTLVAEGMTNKEIAQELGLSDKTVRNYLYRVYKKMQVKGRAHAVRVFLQPVSPRDTWM